MKKLIIVESPFKCVKIMKLLQDEKDEYLCISSFGHFRELNYECIQKIQKIDNSFKPMFSIIENKKINIKKIQKAIECIDVDNIYLASDDDREGESIAWHICDYFNLPIHKTKRIVFHEITGNAIKKALINYRYINMNLVYAQQARQVIDMIVGYKLSPILWKNITQFKKSGLSAGRCQIPALRLVYDNNKNIENNISKMVYNTTGYFTSKNIEFTLNHQFENEEETRNFLNEAINHKHIYNCENVKEVIKKSPIPFTTSGLQQKASSELRISPKDTMTSCQKLYEAGYITYMRTDSNVYCDEFIEETNKHILKLYGENYIRNTNIISLNEKSKEVNKVSKERNSKDKNKQNENEKAHEAIRPTNINIQDINDDTSSNIGKREKSLYKFIYNHTLECCIKDAIYKSVTCKLTAPIGYKYSFSTEKVVFPGWKIVEGYDNESPFFTYIQSLSSNNIIPYKKIISKTSFKNTKSHYNEADIIKLLEEKGIGRPSTFASLLDKIQEREYVCKEDVKGKEIDCIDIILENDSVFDTITKREIGNEKKKLVIKETGIIVLEFLLKNFGKFFEYEYTKNMEDSLDSINKGQIDWRELCNTCLNEIDNACNENIKKNTKTEIEIDKNNKYIIGKYGPVIKHIDENKNIVFKNVNSSLDIDKLQKGEYKLDEILSINKSQESIELGLYLENMVFIRNGRYGYYIEWREIKKSLQNEVENIQEMTLEKAIQLLTNNEKDKENLLIIRKIDDYTSIRKGKYGDYIFHKKKDWKKPKFFKIDDFLKANNNLSYRSCDICFLSTWIYQTYKL